MDEKGFGEQKCISKPSLCNTESKMSILNVEHLTHGIGDSAIFSDISFRLLNISKMKLPEIVPAVV